MRVIGLLVLWCLSAVAQAVVVSDLYQVRVAVADQSQEARQLALQEALQLLVVKVSGNTRSVQSEQIQQEAQRADVYVRSFRYVRAEADGSLMLQASFAQNLIETLLRDAGLPIWGKSRPLVLLWQGVEENLQRTLLSQDSGQWRLLIEQAMGERGVPLLWPTLDMEDQMALPTGSVWGLFREPVRAASERYMADAQMAGRLARQGDGFWQYQGFLQNRDGSVELSARDSDVQVVLRQIADQVAVYLASQYAVRSDALAGGQQIQVIGVENFRQYHDVVAYLKNNVAVKQVGIVQADQDRLTLDLDLAAEWSQVWSVLVLDKRLHPTDQEQVYRWQP